MHPRQQYYWRKDWFEALDIVASAESGREWDDYKAYCRAQEKGLRKQALEHLGRFLDAICTQTLEHRMSFVRWIMPIAHRSPNFEQLLPNPVIERLIKSTLKEGMAQDAHDPDLLFWSGHLLRDADFLRQAIETSPSHVDSRTLLLNWVLSCPDYATHELPAGFIGDPAEALAACDDAEALLHDSLPPERAKMFSDEILQYRQLIADYLASRDKRNSEKGVGRQPATPPRVGD
jgi:hypothetical protein